MLAFVLILLLVNNARAHVYSITNTYTNETVYGDTYYGSRWDSSVYVGYIGYLPQCYNQYPSTEYRTYDIVIVPPRCIVDGFNYDQYGITIINTYRSKPYHERLNAHSERILQLPINAERFNDSWVKIHINLPHDMMRYNKGAESIFIICMIGLIVVMGVTITQCCVNDNKINDINIDHTRAILTHFDNISTIIENNCYINDDDDENNCSICIMSLDDTTTKCELLCKHIFHEDCIMPWLKQNFICPLCKYDFNNIVNNAHNDQIEITIDTIENNDNDEINDDIDI
jgi:hypothetical protein